MQDFMIFIVAFGTSHLYFFHNLEFRPILSATSTFHDAVTCYVYYIKNTVGRDSHTNNDNSIFLPIKIFKRRIREDNLL